MNERRTTELRSAGRRTQMSRQKKADDKVTTADNLLAVEMIVGMVVVIVAIFVSAKLGSLNWLAWVVAIVICVGMDVGRRFMIKRIKARAAAERK